MNHPNNPPRGLNPLWIISLFLGLSEVTVGISATQAQGWIQGLLAIFSVLFPTVVATVFFFILWFRPFVLYAPRDYSDQPSVRDFVTTLSSSTDRSLENAEASIRSALEAVLPEPEDNQEKESKFERAIEVARNELRQRSIEIDLSGIDPNLAHASLALHVTDTTTVSELLNTIYFAISQFVDPFTYGESWILKNANSEFEFTEIGSIKSSTKESGIILDTRPLRDTGIEPGMRLLAIQHDNTRRI
ncbi:hypothetical protein [Halostreptopolyspora alba]|uniref:hypothetical protein n=1 Tax=Halostreptopolyspora alba TaxID=2487137 RepID=UPI0011CE23D7